MLVTHIATICPKQILVKFSATLVIFHLTVCQCTICVQYMEEVAFPSIHVGILKWHYFM